MQEKDSILVTGGAGYIGSHTVVELSEAGYRPVIIDDLSNSEAFIINRIEELVGGSVPFYQGDCNNLDFLREVMSKEPDIKGVIHFAASKSVGESVRVPLKYYRNNIGSLLTLLEAMEAFGIVNLVFSSSCTVYGQPDVLPVTEESPLKPAESPYGETKQICERIIRDAVSSQVPIKAVSLRYFNPIGAHPSSLIGELPIGVPENLVPFLTQSVAGLRDPLVVYGNDYNTEDGTCIRDYIHVVDVSNAHVKTLEYLKLQKSHSFYDVFNLGTGKGNSVLEIIETFKEVTRESVNYSMGGRRQGDVEKVWADTSKVVATLDWQCQKDLSDSLRDSWNWQKTLSSKAAR